MLLLSSIKQNWKYLILLFCTFLLAEIIVNPIGNFPLNDDWVYAKATRFFHEKGIPDADCWGRASMIMHILFGNFFTCIFGFSFTALRFSTLFLSFTGIVFVFLFLKNNFLNNSFHSFLITLLFLFNPLYLNLSNSFMTDVPFIVTLILALFFYYTHQQRSQSIYLVLSILFFVWCILIRQLGICFVLGICLTDIFLKRNINLKTLLLFFVPVLALYVFEYWYHLKVSSSSDGSYSYLFFKNNNSADLTSFSAVSINFLKRWVHYISFTGFVLCPLLLAYLVSFIREKKYLLQKKQIILSVILLLPVIWSLQKFPIGNYLYNSGVGPETSYDTFFLHQNTDHAGSNFIFWVIKVLSILGSFSLLLILVDHLFTFKKSMPILIALFISLFFYYLFLAKSDSIFDRYILLFSLFIIPAVIEKSQNIFSKPNLFYCLLSLLILFSVLTTKDYLNSNRTKWAAINFLKEQNNATDLEINAGYEHEGSLALDNLSWYDKWKNIPENKYLVGFGNVPGYEKLTFFACKRYVPYKNDTVFVLKLKDKVPLKDL